MRSWVTLAFLLLSAIALNAQEWQEVEGFPGGGRDDGTVFTIGSKAYFGLGMDAGFGCNNDFYAFDIDTESWSSAAPLPAGQERQYANGFAHGGSGYVFGGVNGSNYLNDLWKFDAADNSWTALPPLPASGRSGAVCFVIADTAYIVGGKSPSAFALNEMWAYSLHEDTWSQKASPPSSGMWRGVSFSWNGKGIVGLGKDNLNNLNAIFYSYDPQTDIWGTIPQLATEGTTYTAFAQIGALAYLYGGMDASGTYLNAFQRIDLETFETHSLTSFPSDARRGSMAFAGDDAFYLTTGVSATARLDETWKASHILGVEENEAVQSFKVFPNPSNGVLHIQSDQVIHEIVIHDLLGKVVFQQMVESKEVVLETGLCKGGYLIQNLKFEIQN